MSKIITIDECSRYLEQVIKLGDANKDTLGFLQRGAFIEQAARKQILVALDKDENFLGYLLYGINRRELLVYITHLCAKESQRGKGVATELFNELKRLTKDTFRGIRVRCRRDYEIDSLWEGLGFVAINDMPGRSRHGTTLTVWWFDNGHPTLFTYAYEQRTRSKLKVAIDANVFFQLQEPPNSENEESQSLLVDWLEENIELCLTTEIFNEINRNRSEIERKCSRVFTSRFMTLPSHPDDEFQKISEELQKFFPQTMKESDKSDLRQLARTIVAGTKFFVTRDDILLKKSDQIYKDFEMQIIRPSDLIVRQDSLLREADYRPVRLAGSRIETRRSNSEDRSFLEDTFLVRQGGSKADFRQRLNRCLADPHTFETNIIEDRERPLALIVYGYQTRTEIEIPVFRILKDPLSAVLARHLIFQAILTSGKEKILIKVTEPYLSDDAIDALRENGFVFINGTWMKAKLDIADTSERLASKLISLSIQFPQSSQYFQEMADLLKTAKSANNTRTLLNIERSLQPAKITNLDIPAFIVPIRPEWAMSLFDSEIARQDLFGAMKPRLMFNTENVYYRSAHTKVLSAPGRILWYVKKGVYHRVMSIRACSYLDEVVIDKAKTLYSRFQNLGVYEWKDVFELAGGNPDQKIMAFRFSNTQIFDEPVPIYGPNGEKNFNPPQSPVSIPNEHFFHLYQMGYPDSLKG